MATVKPASPELGDDAIGTWTAHGASEIFDCLDNYDDAKYATAAAAVTDRTSWTASGSIDPNVNPTGLYVNLRMRRSATAPNTGSIMAVRIFADNGRSAVIANIDANALTTSFVDFSVHCTGDYANVGSGTGSPKMWLIFVPQPGNAGTVDVSYFSFGTAESASTDYPRAGGASVTMSGDSTHPKATAKAGGAATTMSGSATHPKATAKSGGASVTMTGSGTEVQPVAMITVSVTGPGVVSPSTTDVLIGHNQAFTITPNSGCTLREVLIDGVSVGPVTSYTFTNVQVPHTLSAIFTPPTFTAYDFNMVNPGSAGIAFSSLATEERDARWRFPDEVRPSPAPAVKKPGDKEDE